MGNFCYSEGTYSSERELYIQECEQIDRKTARQWRQQRLNHRRASVQKMSDSDHEDEEENLHPQASPKKEEVLAHAENYDSNHNAWSFKLF
ncbi:hypothetical protein pb186bvf_019795 [Paramecium bursaria]